MLISIGQKLPGFEMEDHLGSKVNNQNLLGKKTIITVYAQDDSPSCTKQVCSLNDSMALLKKAGYQIYGISPDTVKKHQKFAAKHQISYPLLADPEKKYLTGWGLFGPKIFMGKEVNGVYRSAIVLDENGTVTHLINKVLSADHGNQLLEVLGLK